MKFFLNYSWSSVIQEHKEFYTNISIRGNSILVCGYLNGERYRNVIHYKPCFFLPTKDTTSKYKNLQGKLVEKREFNNIKSARKFYREYGDVEGFEIYGLNKFVYTYINDTFKDNIDYDSSLIRVFNIDIETDATGGFADLQTANKPVTLIGIGINKKRIIFGYKEAYKPKNKNVHFVKCANESDMLSKFINFISNEEYRPDVITGWNVEKYDIPYLVNRIKNIFGEKEANRLSPWGFLQEKNIEVRGKEYRIYIPVGISILDYYDLYRKFTYNQLESYTLDHVAFIETGKRKLDYSEYDSLQNLYDLNFEKYVDYNITDIDRVADIDEKNKFIELVYAMAYDAKVNYTDALTSVLLWDVIIHNYLMKKNTVIPKDMSSEFMNIPGGFVKDPQIGMHDWVVSFDLQSLYPHLILQYNISPETFKEIKPWTNKNIEDVIKNGNIDLGELQEKNLTQCGNGARFDKSRRGFLPELMRIQFDQRVAYKNKMLDLKKNNPDATNEITKYHNYQLAKKIQLNSAYGAIANEYCRYYDWRLASAITLSGQLSIRWIEKKLNEFLNDILKTEMDYIIAIDTDSCYINFKPFVDKFLKDETDKTKIINFLDKIAKTQIQPYLTKCYDELANTMNAYENAMFMKRESIAEKALWKQKKHYIMNIWDQEGVRYNEPELKIMGIEAVKSIIPQACRTAIKETLKLIMTSDEKTVRKYISDFREKFNVLSFEDVAFPRGINGIDKYKDAVTLWKKSTPIHVKAAIVYNNLIKMKKLDDRYPLIYDKSKLKFCYLKMPNISLSPVIAAPRILPKQLNLDQHIDRDLMFSKTFLGPIQSLLNIIGWSYEEKSTIEAFFGD